jgi:mannose-6-phosphate isomerase class I
MQRPALWKLAPVAVTKPWGLVHQSAVDLTGIKAGVGELWLSSAQTGPGNYSTAVVEPPLRTDLASLLQQAASEGDAALEEVLGPTPVAHLRNNPHRGKTEAWYIRQAIGRVGVVAGPRTQDDADRLREIITGRGLEPRPEAWSDEVRQLFGVIEPLSGGEVFFAPAGALHTMFAVGPESVLIIDEIQQGYGQALLPTLTKILMVQDDLLSVQVHPDDRTVGETASGRLAIEQDLQANPTVRVYDFGRRPGECPELGFRLVKPEAGLRRVPPLKVAQAGSEFEVMVADPHFVKARLQLKAGTCCDVGPRYGSYHVLHCLGGSARLSARDEAMDIQRGQTVMVPSCLESELRIEADSECSVFDDSLPDLAALEEFLSDRGAERAEIEALRHPPPAR